MKNKKVSKQSLLYFSLFLLFILFLFLVLKLKNLNASISELNPILSISGFVIGVGGDNDKSQMVYCDNPDLSRLASSNMQYIDGCYNHIDLFMQYSVQNGITERGIDPIMIMAIAMQESKCGYISNYRGILQVDDTCTRDQPCVTVASQIDAGIHNFKRKFDSISKKNLSPKDTLILALFAYNRGERTAISAAEKVQVGKTLTDAMIEACRENYLDSPSVCRGDYVRCLYTSPESGSKNKCIDAGMGAAYPETILNYFNQICLAAGGEVKNGIYVDTMKKGSGISGVYTVMPHFNVFVNYNLSVYELIKTFTSNVKTHCVDNLESCLDKAVSDFNINNPNMKMTYDCEEGPFKVFYDAMERLQECSEVNVTDCACKLTNLYSNDEIKNKKLKGEFEFKFSIQDDKVLVQMTKPIINYYSFSINQSTNIPEIYSIKYDDDGYIKSVIGDDGFDTINPNKRIYRTYISTPNKEEIFLYISNYSKNFTKIENINPNINNNKLFFSDYDQNGVDYKECIYQKQKFRLCLKTNDEIPQLDDNMNTVLKPVNIKFAINLYDNIAPLAVIGLSVINVSADVYKLQWSDNPTNTQDVVAYNIYYSDQNFVNTDKNDFMQSGGVVRRFGIPWVSEHFNDNYYHLDVIYNDPISNLKTTYIQIPVTKKYFAVIAVDKNNNEIKFSELVPGNNYFVFSSS
ncbi:MAG: hypothetical protein QXG00_00245 [Candidatus Woesearchaeota archaeon]